MYESSRKILALFIVMILGEIGVIAYVVGANIPGEVGESLVLYFMLLMLFSAFARFLLNLELVFLSSGFAEDTCLAP